MPPKVERQMARPAARPSTNGAGVLERIAPIKQSNIGRLKMAVYGCPKTGKTRLACTFPKRLLIIGAEDGTASVVGSRDVDFVQLKSTDEFGEVVSEVLTGRWRTVVVDTATKLRDMRIAEILGLSEAPTQKGFGFAKREQWMQCSQNLKDMLRPLLDAPRVMDLNVVVIAQEQNFTSEDGAAQSDLVRPSVGSALGKSVCDWLHAECDYVCQTLIREETQAQSMDVAGEVMVTQVRTGRKQYCLRVGPHEVYQTGFRLPGGRTIEEEFIVNPSYAKIAALIEGKKV